jgi:hypothetical protein
VDRGDSPDGRTIRRRDLVPDEGPWKVRPEGVADDQRDARVPGGVHRGGIDHLRPEVRELHQLRVTQRGEGERSGHDPGVGSHDTVHVGPDLDGLGPQRRPQHRRRVVRPAPPQGAGLSPDGGPHESRDHRHGHAGLTRAAEAFPDPGLRCLGEDASVAEAVIGDQELPGVHGLGRGTHGPERQGAEAGREKLAVGEDRIHRSGGCLPHQGDPVQEVPEILFQEPSEFLLHHLLGPIAPEVVEGIQVTPHHPLEPTPPLVAPCRSGPCRGLELVRDPAQCGHDHHHRPRGRLPGHQRRHLPDPLGRSH